MDVTVFEMENVVQLAKEKFVPGKEHLGVKFVPGQNKYESINFYLQNTELNLRGGIKYHHKSSRSRDIDISYCKK